MWNWAAVFVAASLIGCAAQSDLEQRSFMGMSQTQIRAELGAPDKEDKLTKQGEHIFGPIEGLWDQMPSGETLTIWTYSTSNGRKELYFVGDKPEVAGEFYWYDDDSRNPNF
ncbi:MAG: hypothetical protein O3A53_10495 [Acidobacteria bacterium]|nr:hypothetical protein [Acidobacteriota bacterium]MDA1235218.1 hypothetical protein [Acidobacteriota bacterium]